MSFENEVRRETEEKVIETNKEVIEKIEPTLTQSFPLTSLQPLICQAESLANRKVEEEMQYLDLLRNIIDNGHLEMGRNGNTKSIFGASMRFSLANGKIPILTTKKTAWKTCLKELLWFISGSTDNKVLNAQNVHIWDGNATPEYLATRGLSHYPEGELGPIYSKQWRQFNAPFLKNTGSKSTTKYDSDWLKDEPEKKVKEEGIDQLQQIIDQLKNPLTRNSRRLIMTAWNPCQLDEMALPPCHIMCQFNVHDGNKLSCCMMQRSNDFFLGIPINIASYSFLTHLLAKHCGLEAYEFIHFMGNCHIYENALEAAALQMERKPFPFPTVSIKYIRENINDYKVEDFEIHNYQHHEPIKVAMVA
jgi:thymidylate synthase